MKKFKKLIFIALAVVLLITGSAAAVQAATDDQIPSAQAAFASNDVYAMTADAAKSETPWMDVLTTQIKTGEPKDLVIDVSAETFLATSAKLSGTTGSEALAEIQIQVLVDGMPTLPGVITFDNRLLRITGDLTHHYDGALLPIDDHWIEVYIETKSAHAYNFAIENIGSGVHDVVVQAKLKTDKDLSSNIVDAAIGHISMVVDEAMFKYVGK